MIVSLGCQSANVGQTLLTDSTLTGNNTLPAFDFAENRPPGNRTSANSPSSNLSQRHLVSKPIVQGGQGSGTTGTYPYPAANSPGQGPQLNAFQGGRQNTNPPVSPFRQAQFQQSQVQIPEQAFQLLEPGLQTGVGQPNLAQPGFAQQGFAQQGFAQPNFAQPGFAQPGFGQSGIGQQVQPGFFPNPNLAGQNFSSVQQPEFLDLDVFIPQNPSGRLSVGGTVSSDNSVLGQLILEEHDFDFRAWPRSPSEIFSPRTWRGGGQRFRAEAVPGDDLQRYLISWSDPYFRGTETSLSLSAFLFERDFFDYDERRIGGRISVGRRLSQFVSLNAGLRLEDVDIDNPRVNTSPQLNAVLGDSDLFLGSIGIVYDNRVLPYLTGVGTYFGATFTQAFGDFDYSRGEIEFRNHQKIFARPDDSGRHIIGFRSILGFSGNSTPVFENFFAGGLSTLRGFDFRGVSPIEGDVRVGGEFQWINSLEYTFPVTADDLIRGALFVDFGTVEEDIELNSENFRVAPGLGLRVHLPFAGLGAPLSFDFAFPIATAEGDDEKIFSFFIGAVR